MLGQAVPKSVNLATLTAPPLILQSEAWFEEIKSSSLQDPQSFLAALGRSPTKIAHARWARKIEATPPGTPKPSAPHSGSGSGFGSSTSSDATGFALGSGLRTPIQRPRGGGHPGISPVPHGSPWPLAPMPNFPLTCSPEATVYSMTTPPPNPKRSMRSLEQDLMDAVEQGSVSSLKLALVRSLGCSTCHCLHELVGGRHVEALEFLLRCGADHVDEHRAGVRPVHVALQHCMAEGDMGYRMLQLLLHHGAQPNQIPGDAFGESREAALHDAARRGNAAVVALLLSHGADPDAIDAVGNSPLHVLCQHVAPWSSGSEERIIALLMRAGALPLRNAMGKQPSSIPLDVSLRLRLSQAESWHGRKCFLMAQTRMCYGFGCTGVAASTADKSTPQGFFLPEVFELVAAFL